MTTGKRLLLSLLLAGLFLWWYFRAGRPAATPPPPTQPAAVSTPELFEPTEEGYVKKMLKEMAENRWTDAKKTGKNGLTQYPKCANLLFNLALLEFQTGQYREASSYIEEVLRINDRFWNAHYLRGALLEADGKKDQARAEYVQEINRNPGSRQAWQKIKESTHEKN